MNCKKCNTPMYERKSKRAANATKVYTCPKCGMIIYIWPDGEMKEEGGK